MHRQPKYWLLCALALGACDPENAESTGTDTDAEALDPVCEQAAPVEDPGTALDRHGLAEAPVDIDESLAAKYPYQRAYLPVNRLLDGTLTSW